VKIESAVVVAALLCGALPAAAQGNPGAPGSTQVIPEKQKDQPSEAPTTTGRSDSLSDKLDATGGVIKPSGDVDPGISKAPPANPNTMRVIPPSDTPSGKSGVVPK